MTKVLKKSELVQALAKSTELPASKIDVVLKEFISLTTESVANGDKVQLPGFLTIERVKRAARMGRNPQTGEPLQIAAGYAVKVSPGSTLKDAVKASNEED